MELLNISPTVRGVRSMLADHQTVSAVDVSQAILEKHQHDYARSLPRSLLEPSSASVHRHIDDWLTEIRILFNETLAPELHGRIVILGLSMLDPELGKQLQEHGFLAQLSLELDDSIDEILSGRGHELWDSPTNESAHVLEGFQDVGNNIGESVIDGGVITTPGQGPAQGPDRESELNHSDNPVTKKEDDQLGRHAYARYLAKRLDLIDETRVQTIHVSGPWGAGKSTMLHLLSAELKQRNWMVVEFNAWENKHLRPPWWAIQDSVFEESTHTPSDGLTVDNKTTEFELLGNVHLLIRSVLVGIRDTGITRSARHNVTTESENDNTLISDEKKAPLSGWNLFREYTWRLLVGRTRYFATLFFCSLIVGVLFFVFPFDGELLTTVKNMGTFLSTVVAIWAASQSISFAFSARSTQSAQSYLDTVTDPTGKMAKRFSKLIDRIDAKRVAIFIDDLDRCQSEYVVDLLEGIQTTLSKAPVTFVVAADQSWLNACFEDVYSKFNPHVQEPGKPLGALFLEKLFQFEAPMPGVPEALRDLYWEYLLNMGKTDLAERMQSARDRAREELSNQAPLEGVVLETIEQSHSEDELYQQALREESVVHFATPELIEHIQYHTLKPFPNLLEPNPRSMKRLVNAYSVNRTLSTLTREDIPQKQLALWTIISMRWPKLAEYLAENPKAVENIVQSQKVNGETAISALLKDPVVINVIRGGKVVDALDAATIKKCAQLKM